MANCYECTKNKGTGYKLICPETRGKTYVQFRDKAITRRELRNYFELDIRQDRPLRELINELRHEGCPILYATEPPAGYYLPTTLSELQEGLTTLRKPVIDTCQCIMAVKQGGHRYIAGEAQGKLL